MLLRHRDYTGCGKEKKVNVLHYSLEICGYYVEMNKYPMLRNIC